MTLGSVAGCVVLTWVAVGFVSHHAPHQKPQTGVPAGRQSATLKPLDIGKLETDVSHQRSDAFRRTRTATYEYKNQPFAVEVVRLASDFTGTYTIMAFGLQTDAEPLAFYKSGFIRPECGTLEVDVPAVTLMSLADRPLVVIDERRYATGCSGESTKDTLSARFYDAANGFKQVWTQERLTVDFNDDGRSAPRASSRVTYLYANGCLRWPEQCSFISVFTTSSDRTYRQPYYSYQWNKDFSAIVGVR